jgi:nucleotide-binding universal stress UspA family protein
MLPLSLGADMRRREFITLIGGAAAWPLAAHAQAPDGMRLVGVLMAYAESDPEGQAWVAAFRERLQKLGWAEGRNVRIVTRWATPNVEAMQRFAKELVALQPDLILSQSSPTTAALLQHTRTIPIIFANIVRHTLGDLQTDYLEDRGLSPVGVAEGTGSPSPVRNISNSVTPMPSWRAIGSGPFDCARNRSYLRQRAR